MKPDIVIGLCVRSGTPLRDWAEAGYQCYAVDIQHSPRRLQTESVGTGSIHYIYGDVRSWLPPDGCRIAALFAHPPCTHVAVSGARDFKRKGPALLADALSTFAACEVAARYSGAPYYIENPVGVLSSHIRKPDCIVHPWQYAGYLPDIQVDNTCKATCLWTGNGFVIPDPIPAPAPHRQDCWLASKTDGRGDIRSVTPAGFARAVFMANHNRNGGGE